MIQDGFTAGAAFYERDSLVQKSAAEVLLDLISIKGDEDVLDLGCGPGHVTRKIAGLTGGRVVGTDVSEGMIGEALQSGNSPPHAGYLIRDAEDLGFCESFDVIYCNSAFQWFLRPERVLQQCYAALRPGGRMGVQAPATSLYCPNFIAAVDKVRKDPDTGPVFSTFKSPWFFLERGQEYRSLFEGHGFTVAHCRLQKEESCYTAGQVYRIFRSGAENGYLSRDFYPVPPDDGYIEEFRRLVWDSIMEQSDSSGLVRLEFTRVYLIAFK